jgi:hypothetical protein
VWKSQRQAPKIKMPSFDGLAAYRAAFSKPFCPSSNMDNITHSKEADVLKVQI